jgi:magnesium transporter
MKSRKKIPQRNSRRPLEKGKRISGKTGLPPGSLIHIGKVLTDSVRINLTEFNASEISHKTIASLDGLDVKNESFNSWIEISGLHEPKIIESVGQLLGINPLVLEDILNTEHRPKFDIQDGMIFLTLRAFSLSGNREIQSEQASFVLGKSFLVSFQETNHSWFDPVKFRLDNCVGKIRHKGLDFILYSLIDVIVDQYYAVAEEIGDRLEEIEEQIFENPSRELLEKIRLTKKEIITIRKSLTPLLEAISKLNRDEPELIGLEVMRYYDDIRDHIVQIVDYIDTYRELSAELKESYLSNLTLRMNQVMKLLTIITTIFIPLTFIAGVYGMNFENMPELYWEYGYFFILAIMLVIVTGMLIYFRRRKWI